MKSIVFVVILLLLFSLLILRILSPFDFSINPHIYLYTFISFLPNNCHLIREEKEHYLSMILQHSWSHWSSLDFPHSTRVHHEQSNAPPVCNQGSELKEERTSAGIRLSMPVPSLVGQAWYEVIAIQACSIPVDSDPNNRAGRRGHLLRRCESTFIPSRRHSDESIGEDASISLLHPDEKSHQRQWQEQVSEFREGEKGSTWLDAISNNASKMCVHTG